MKISCVAVILALALSGCFQQIAVSSLGGIMDTGFEVLNEEQDLGLAEKSIASNLKLIETILRQDPDNPRYLLLASNCYTSYALGFVEDDSTPRARLFYLRARDYGMRILKRHRQFQAHAERGIEEFTKGFAGLSKEDVPAAFWTAAGWGSYIRSDLSDLTAVAEIPKVEALTKFVLKSDSSFFYGGAHFLLGTLYGSRPPIFGGDPEISRKHFEECLRMNGGKFLMTYIYYAASYAVQTQDMALFERCLTTVDTTSLEVLPASRLSNAIAKKKAKLLRSRIEELF
ncbi:MAG: hypothetical protein E6K56_09720 [Ignavibacteria bacterium]|nr:MAG: hypothetical protein E6K56_09720 [Ignavibacteria bacterium]